jgi:hypothetical protein
LPMDLLRSEAPTSDLRCWRITEVEPLKEVRPPTPTLRVGAAHVIVNGTLEGHISWWTAGRVTDKTSFPAHAGLVACPASLDQAWHVDDVEVYELAERPCPAQR